MGYVVELSSSERRSIASIRDEENNAHLTRTKYEGASHNLKSECEEFIGIKIYKAGIIETNLGFYLLLNYETSATYYVNLCLIDFSLNSLFIALIKQFSINHAKIVLIP